MRSFVKLGALVGMALGCGCSQPNAYQPPPPPKVTVAKPIVQNVTLYLEETGQTEAVEHAVVQARVQGVLEKIEFTPGQNIELGKPLYQIEKRQYEAAEQSALAEKTSAEAARIAAEAAIEVAKSNITAAKAAANQTQLEFLRLDGLLKENAVPRADWELAQAKRDSAAAAQDGAQSELSVANADLEKAKAQVAKAEADLNQAQINLDYTNVVAPITGRTSRTAVKVGNLVENGTELVTIVQNDPIWTNFNISERFLLTLGRFAKRNDENELDVTHIKAYLQRSGDKGFPFEGNLDFFDNQVDQATGTFTLRAKFPNESRQLLAGLFVRIRVPLGELENAILIPEPAISRDQVGTYVLSVGADNMVERKNVTLGPKEGDFVVVETGLTGDETIVVIGIQKARPGNPVEPTMTTLTPPESQPTPDDGSVPASDDQ